MPSSTRLIPLSALAAQVLALPAATPEPEPATPSPGLLRARTLDTDALISLWASYNGTSTMVSDIDGEDVHTALNERGLGHLCAV